MAGRHSGFTLIELMIVIAIIGVISAIAIPVYQNYMIKSQITTALSELNGAKTQYELIMNDGSASNTSDFTVVNMFFSTTSNFCIYAVYAPVSGQAKPALECKLKNVSVDLNGKFVYLNRDKNGTWGCATSAGIDAKLKPSYCS